MKTNKESYPKIGKTVHFDMSQLTNTTNINSYFKVKALMNDWTKEELQKIWNFLVDKPYEEQLNILNHYCISPYEQAEIIHQTDVVYMLSFLELHLHYLNTKPVESWDEYDWSNYKSLNRRATSRIVRKYAYYCDAVEEKHKYEVDSPPTLFFDTKEEAEKLLPENELETTNIYALWIQE